MKTDTILLAAIAGLMLTACGGQQDHSAAGEQPGQRLGGAPPPAQSDIALTFDDALPPARQPGLLRQGGAAPESVLAIDTQSRESVRNFYNGLYPQSDNVPMGWTGNYATGDAGTVSAAYQAATALRLNWFRAMAGVPAAITFSAENSAKDQQAALMMSANGQLSHSPPSSWINYTADGALAASQSNLTLGNAAAGPDGIVNYIFDAGSNNGPVGHRRWVLYPQTQVMGSGSVPGGVNGAGQTLYSANALWTFDANISGNRPAVRDDFIAWPPKGYVPYQMAYGRWSFSYKKADFSKASVTVSRDGVNVPVTLEPLFNGYGENTLVWLLQNTTDSSVSARPAQDQRYTVSIGNALVDGQARTFSYTVVVFDPATPGPDTVVTTLTLPSSVNPGSPFALAVSAASAGATGYQLRQYTSAPVAATSYSMGNSSGIWLPQLSQPYNSTSTDAFHLCHPTYADQSLLLNKQLLLGSRSRLAFDKQAGLATPDEQFKVQLSLDDGASWRDVFSESGTGATGAPATAADIDLSPYAGKMARLRFLLTTLNRYYYCSDSTGWHFNHLVLSNADEVSNPQLTTLAGGSSTLAIAAPGSYVFFARAQYQNRYYGDWGPVARTQVGGLVLTGKLANYTIARTADGYTLTDNVGNDGTRVLSNPARLDFADVSVAFDLDGNAGKAYRLYRAALNRVPDQAGLGYWIQALDSGVSLDAMASGFAASDEFRTLYGSNPSAAQLVTAIYSNVLHRAPDPDGYAFWLGALNGGAPVSALLGAFSESPENTAQVAATLPGWVVYARR